MSEDRVPYDTASTTKKTLEEQKEEAIQDAMDHELVTLEMVKLKELPAEYFAQEWRKRFRSLVTLTEAAVLYLQSKGLEQVKREDCSTAISIPFKLVLPCFTCLQDMIAKVKGGTHVSS